MQINHDLQIVVLGPLDSLVEVWELTLDVRFASTDVPSPVAYGYTNVVEAVNIQISTPSGDSKTNRLPSCSDVGKVVLSDPL